MPWINSSKEHAHRTSGEFPVVDGWIAHGRGHGREIGRLYEIVEAWGIRSRITRVLSDAPGLACLILGVLEQARQAGLTGRARLSWVEETPNQLLLEVPATPELASAFLDQIDEWIIDNYSVDMHRRLIVDVCFPA